jgi:hypothetical protein
VAVVVVVFFFLGVDVDLGVDVHDRLERIGAVRGGFAPVNGGVDRDGCVVFSANAVNDE